MRRGRGGFTLIEVMITLVILFLVVDALSAFFLGALRQYKQQSKLAESGVQSIVGLEILRKDLEHAGYGLPWNNIVSYNEAGSAPASSLNDAPSNAPRAIASLDDAQMNGSDYLAVKSVLVSTDPACKRWTTLGWGNVKRTWNDASDNFLSTDRVLVMAPGNADTNWRSLVTSGGAFSTTYASTAGFAPPDGMTTYVIYGIDSSNVRFPFNRADYYIDNTSVPSMCAPGTGVLVKRVLGHNNAGTLGPPLPLLDCVADMQVFYLRDTNGDGTIDNTASDISGLSAQQVREQVRQVAVFILAQEGQRDPAYTHSPATFFVGNAGLGIGKNFDLSVVPGYQNYRWKLHSVVVDPTSLRF